LILAEDAVGEQEALRTHLQPAIWEVININVLAAEISGHGIPFQDDSLSIVGQSQLAAHIALLAMAQDRVTEPCPKVPQL
jgi:hypothetical protein